MQNTDRRVEQRGFTLIEIMVVIVILGLLATMIATSVNQHHEDAQVTRARADLKTLHEAAVMYRMKHGRWPTMAELTERDQNGWQAISTKSDPWQRDYLLRPGERPGDFTVLSLGADGQEGTDDDVRLGPE